MTTHTVTLTDAQIEVIHQASDEKRPMDALTGVIDAIREQTKPPYKVGELYEVTTRGDNTAVTVARWDGRRFVTMRSSNRDLALAWVEPTAAAATRHIPVQPVITDELVNRALDAFQSHPSIHDGMRVVFKMVLGMAEGGEDQ